MTSELIKLLPWIVTIIFAAGGVIMKIKTLDKDIRKNESRVDEKINRLETRVKIVEESNHDLQLVITRFEEQLKSIAKDIHELVTLTKGKS